MPSQSAMYRLKPHIGHVSYTLPIIKPRPGPSESLGMTVFHLSLLNTSTRIRLLLCRSYGLITQQHWLGMLTASQDFHTLTHFQDQPATLLLLPTGGWRSYPRITVRYERYPTSANDIGDDVGGLRSTLPTYLRTTLDHNPCKIL
jgi:hypothetical protein